MKALFHGKILSSLMNYQKIKKKEERSLRAHYPFFLPSDRVRKQEVPLVLTAETKICGEKPEMAFKNSTKIVPGCKAERYTEWLRWDGTSGDYLVQPTYSSRARCPGACPDGFWVPPRMEAPQTPWANCARSQQPAQWKTVSCISVCALYLWS